MDGRTDGHVPRKTTSNRVFSFMDGWMDGWMGINNLDKGVSSRDVLTEHFYYFTDNYSLNRKDKKL